MDDILHETFSAPKSNKTKISSARQIWLEEEAKEKKLLEA